MLRAQQHTGHHCPCTVLACPCTVICRAPVPGVYLVHNLERCAKKEGRLAESGLSFHQRGPPKAAPRPSSACAPACSLGSQSVKAFTGEACGLFSIWLCWRTCRTTLIVAASALLLRLHVIAVNYFSKTVLELVWHARVQCAAAAAVSKSTETVQVCLVHVGAYIRTCACASESACACVLSLFECTCFSVSTQMGIYAYVCLYVCLHMWT